MLAALALAAFGLCGCGDDDGDGVDFCTAFPADPLCQKNIPGGDDCSRALDVYFSGYDQACAQYRGCCICDCWLNGRQIPIDEQGCQCSPIPRYECDQEMMEFAQECLADPAACKQAAASYIENYCLDY